VHITNQDSRRNAYRSLEEEVHSETAYFTLENNQTLSKTIYDLDGFFRMTGLLISDIGSGQRNYKKINENSFIIT
jgi:hypothetical protein